ncbi:MAG: FAD:protein FMN transferase [bacterium]|nr:FAD:protein FMN transferase [bacterium]
MSSSCYASRRIKSFLIIIVGILLVSVLYWRYTELSHKITKVTAFLMDTLVTIEIEGSGEFNLAANEGIEIMQDLQNKFDVNINSSEITKINLSAGINPVKVSADTLELLKEAIRISKLTEGAFDITIGVLTREWGFTDGNYRVPSDREIKDRLKLVDYNGIKIYDSEVRLSKKGMFLDLGGIAKGYAVDKVYDFLKSKGVKRAIINAGGTIKTLERDPKRTWRIGIKDPTGNKDILGVLYLDSGLAVATSGDYERYFIKDGVKYHHLLNPKTGYPSSLCKSVTVVSKKAVEADALSTAIFVLGPKRGLSLAKRLDLGVIIVDSEDNIFVSDNLKGRFKPDGE